MLVRQEFQFPGDLWLPRRENRCRQPPNNHTSYDYHTPEVYTRTPYPRLSLSLPPLLSRSFSLARTRALLRRPLFIPAFFISTCLITNSQAYLPASLEKNCSGFELLRVILLSFSRGSNYYSLFLRPRFKLSCEMRIIIYWPFVSNIQVVVSFVIFNVSSKRATLAFVSFFPLSLLFFSSSASLS